MYANNKGEMGKGLVLKLNILVQPEHRHLIPRISSHMSKKYDI